jgi:hypothetical protein
MDLRIVDTYFVWEEAMQLQEQHKFALPLKLLLQNVKSTDHWQHV